ncbi:MAG: copper chaperone CopZ [Flavobacteriales bacterium]|jgi:copper chaperone CopZ
MNHIIFFFHEFIDVSRLFTFKQLFLHCMVQSKIIQLVFVCLLTIFLPAMSFGQFQSVEIGVNGLTCSVCTRSVEMSIRKLDFIDNVVMDLSNTKGQITITKDAEVSIKAIAKAVTDAGFSVRYLHATFYFNDLSIEENYCWNYENEQYQFVKTKNQTLNGPVIVKVLGKKFLSKKEMKKWKPLITNPQENKCNAKVNYYITL